VVTVIGGSFIWNAHIAAIAEAEVDILTYSISERATVSLWLAIASSKSENTILPS